MTPASNMQFLHTPPPSRGTGEPVQNEIVVYHIGASLKDLGKSLFAFSKLSIPARDILSKLA